MVAALFYFRVFGLRKHIYEVSAHVAKLETVFGLSQLGWDFYWSKTPTGIHRVSLLDRWRSLYWLALVLINLAVPFLLQVRAPASQSASLPTQPEVMQQQGETLKRIEAELIQIQAALTGKPKPVQTIPATIK